MSYPSTFPECLYVAYSYKSRVLHYSIIHKTNSEAMITHETINPNFKINTSKSLCSLEAIDTRDNDSCNSSGDDESIEYNAYSLCDRTKKIEILKNILNKFHE